MQAQSTNTQFGSSINPAKSQEGMEIEAEVISAEVSASLSAAAAEAVVAAEAAATSNSNVIIESQVATSLVTRSVASGEVDESIINNNDKENSQNNIRKDQLDEDVNATNTTSHDGKADEVTTVA